MTLKDLTEQIHDNLAITCLQYSVKVEQLKLVDIGKCSDSNALYVLIEIKDIV